LSGNSGFDWLLSQQWFLADVRATRVKRDDGLFLFCLENREIHKPYRLTLITLSVIILAMIRTFANNETEKLFGRMFSRKLPQSIQLGARMKLEVLDAAEVFQDLRIPPSNRLEKLSGNREGQYSIRINDQWRICFVWQQENAFDVEIVDYH
jgi:proteic killer suppression protein